MGKLPGLLIFHGKRGSIAVPTVNMHRRMLPHHPSCNDHHQWNDQIAHEHSPPKPHFYLQAACGGSNSDGNFTAELCSKNGLRPIFR